MKSLGLLSLLVLFSLAAYYVYGVIFSLFHVQPALKAQIETALALLTGLLFFLVTTRLGRRAFRVARQFVYGLSLLDFVVGIISLIVGLIIGALLSVPLSRIPSPFSWLSGIAIEIVVTMITAWAFHLKRFTFSHWFNNLPFVAKLSEIPGDVNSSVTPIELSQNSKPMLLDTSAIIDGRIGDVIKTGFMHGTFMVPVFVLNELQYIADSGQALKRQRGRKGLSLLQSLKKSKTIALRIDDHDFPGVNEVDQKLILLALQTNAQIITCDYNLNRVAALQGITVLNINDLANTLRIRYVPGDTIEVQVIQQGKDPKQGIGYMQDGTMVVVENGAKYLDQQIEAQVQRVIQTSAGRMVFAKSA